MIAMTALRTSIVNLTLRTLLTIHLNLAFIWRDIKVYKTC